MPAAATPSPANPMKEERKSIKEALAESEARELDFDPTDRIAAVNKLMQEIPALKKEGKTLQEAQEALGDLFEQYPELFKKIYAGEDLSQLELMMKMMAHMDRRELTPHQASVIVGRQLANQYIPADLMKKEAAAAAAASRKKKKD